MYTVLLFIFIFMLGSVMGSFVGAVTWRMKHHKDWVRGRSECEQCHHPLAVLDLIPILSYLGLRGKCRYCHKRISASTLGLEIGGGLTFLVSALLYPSMIAGQWMAPQEIWAILTPWAWVALVLWLICLVLLMALFIYDWRWRILPNKLVLPLVVVSFIYSAISHLAIDHISMVNWLVEMALGLLPITGVYGVLYIISHGRWIGLGDIKLGVAIGLLIPWWGGLVVLFLANLLGSLVSLPQLISHKVKGSTEIAFGPYLITATYVVFLIGWWLAQCWSGLMFF